MSQKHQRNEHLLDVLSNNFVNTQSLKNLNFIYIDFPDNFVSEYLMKGGGLTPRKGGGILGGQKGLTF